jgi:hypothetical protein
MCPQNQSQTLILTPFIPISNTTENINFMYSFNIAPVFFIVAWFGFCGGMKSVELLGAFFHCCHYCFGYGVVAGWVGDEEGVLHVTGWMLLKDKEGVKVLETEVYMACFGTVSKAK